MLYYSGSLNLLDPYQYAILGILPEKDWGQLKPNAVVFKYFRIFLFGKKLEGGRVKNVCLTNAGITVTPSILYESHAFQQNLMVSCTIPVNSYTINIHLSHFITLFSVPLKQIDQYSLITQQSSSVVFGLPQCINLCCPFWCCGMCL